MAKILTSSHLENRIYPAYKILNAVEVMAALNVPPATILTGTTLSDESLKSAKTRITLGELATVYQNIQSLKIAPDIALRIGRRLTPSAYGAFGFAVATSPTLASALDVIISYPELATPVVLMSLSLDCDSDLVRVVFRDNLQIAGLHQFNIESHSAMLCSVLALITGEPSPLIEIWFRFPQPNSISYYKDTFGCRCCFQMPQNALILRKSILSHSLTQANPITAETMRDACLSAVTQLRAQQHLTTKVIQLLTADLHSTLTIEQAARKLGMTERTMRRYLVEEGTSFKRILSDYRLRRAIHLLKNRRLNADEAAHELGYAETSNFRTAFKSWTGLTIGEFINFEPT